MNICRSPPLPRSRCSPIAKSAWGHSDGEIGHRARPLLPSFFLPRQRGRAGGRGGGRAATGGGVGRAATMRDERATVATATAKVERRITEAEGERDGRTDGRADERTDGGRRARRSGQAAKLDSRVSHPRGVREGASERDQERLTKVSGALQKLYHRIAEERASSAVPHTDRLTPQDSQT